MSKPHGITYLASLFEELNELLEAGILIREEEPDGTTYICEGPKYRPKHEARVAALLGPRELR